MQCMFEKTYKFFVSEDMSDDGMSGACLEDSGLEELCLSVQLHVTHAHVKPLECKLRG